MGRREAGLASSFRFAVILSGRSDTNLRLISEAEFAVLNIFLLFSSLSSRSLASYTYPGSLVVCRSSRASAVGHCGLRIFVAPLWPGTSLAS